MTRHVNKIRLDVYITDNYGKFVLDLFKKMTSKEIKRFNKYSKCYNLREKFIGLILKHSLKH